MIGNSHKPDASTVRVGGAHDDGGASSQGPAGSFDLAERLAFDGVLGRLLGREQGVHLGRYLVRATVGRGAFGEVYQAYDTELDREVAIKVLLPARAHSDDGREQAGLLDEARALARLRHPNVVEVFDVGAGIVGRHADGTKQHGVYVVMQWLPGENLARWCATGPPWRAIVDAYRQVALGLHAAHDAGLVHGDVKPHNAIIDELGRVRLVDFGLAREAVVPRAAWSTLISGTGDSVATTIAGTPLYMAPEQHGGHMSPMADQFALSVSLWQALAGEAPFAGTTLAELAAAKEIPPTARRGGEVPSELWAVLGRGLAATAARRHADLAAWTRALDRACRPSVRARRAFLTIAMCGVAAASVYAVREAQRQSALAACASEAADIETVWTDAVRAEIHGAMLSSGAAGVDVSFERMAPWIDRCVEQWQHLRGEVCVAARAEDGWTDAEYARSIDCFDEHRWALEALLDELRSGEVGVVYGAVAAAAGLPRLEPCADRLTLSHRPALPEDPRRRADVIEIRRALARVDAAHAAGRFAHGLERAQELAARAEVVGFVPLVAAIDLRIGRLRARLGDFAGAERDLTRAFFTAEAAEQDRLSVTAATTLVDVVGYRLARPEEGLHWGRAARALLERLDDRDGVAAAELLSALAPVLLEQGDVAGAQANYEQALSIFQEVLGAEHPAVARTYNSFATVPVALGDDRRGLELLERALTLAERTLGEQHPDVATDLVNIAKMRHGMGDYAGAIPLSERALAIRLASLRPDSPLVAEALQLSFAAKYVAGDYSAAVELGERILAIQVRALGEDHRDVCTMQTNLAGAYSAAGDRASAMRMYDRVVLNRGASKPSVAQSLVGLGNEYLETGKHAESRTFLARGLELQEQLYGKEHPSVATTISFLGYAAQAAGEWAVAQDFFLRALAIWAKLDTDAEGVAYANLAMAQVLIEQGKRGEAQAWAERATELLARVSAPPHLVAWSQFVLARALWVSARQRPRARALAELARAGLLEVPADFEYDASDVVAWLARPR